MDNELTYNNIVSVLSNLPEFSKLTKCQKENIAKYTALQIYSDDLKQQAKINKYNFNELIEKFLCKFKSVNTKSNYARYIAMFSDYCNRSCINPLYLNNSSITDFIQTLSNYSNNSQRLIIACLGSLYSFISWYSNSNIPNYFQNIKQLRPKNKLTAKNKFYFNNLPLDKVQKELEIIINSVKSPLLRSCLIIMKNEGLRVGAFENCHIKNNTIFYESKGKNNLYKNLSDNTIKELKNNEIVVDDLDFAKTTSIKLKNLLKDYTKKLYSKGAISCPYSCHDFRHFFALSTYAKNKDIYSLSRLLDHSNIAITEHYLRGFKVL